MRSSFRLLLAASSFVLVACGGTSPDHLDGGTGNPDASTPSDAGQPDAGQTQSDAGQPDASVPTDSGVPDAGSACTPALLTVCGRGDAGVTCATATADGGFTTLGGTWQTQLFNDATGWAGLAYSTTLQFPDVTGDGIADVCARGVNGIDCATGTGTGFTGFGVWVAEFLDSTGWSSSPAYYGTIQFPDINGDGKADVCGRGVNGIVCATSTGSAFSGVTVTSSFNDASGWGTSPSTYGTIQFPDVNGDGKADVCGRGSNGISCALSTGTTFGTFTAWNSDFANNTGWDTSASYYGTIQYPDVNGDGKADVCGRGTSGVICAISNGTGFGATSQWLADFNNAGGWNSSAVYYATIQFPDLNGDGKADVCGRGVNGVVCALSTGSAFGAVTVSPAFNDGSGWAQTPAFATTLQFPDVNGDGKADVCARGVAGIDCALSTGSAFGTFFTTPAEMSDLNGWSVRSSYATIRYPFASPGTCSPRRKPTPQPSPAARFGL